MIFVRPLRNAIRSFRSLQIVNYSLAANQTDHAPFVAASQCADQLIKFYTKGQKPDPSLILTANSLCHVPPKMALTPLHLCSQFVKEGVNIYLDDVEAFLKDQTKSVDLDRFCLIFHRLMKLNVQWRNEIVQTCGLERIVNLAKLIVERPEDIKEAKYLEMLCRAISKLIVIPDYGSANKNLKMLFKPLIPALLSRLFAENLRNINWTGFGNAISRISPLLVDELSDVEKAKIARIVCKEFFGSIAENPRKFIFFSLFRMADLFVLFDVKEEKGSFEWVDGYIKYWQLYGQNRNSPDPSRMKAIGYLNFVLIMLKNGKYDVVEAQKDVWSDVLRQCRPTLAEVELEKWRERFEKVPTIDETGKKLVDELKSLLK